MEYAATAYPEDIVLRKILGAFKTSFMKAMEIEAVIPLFRVRFEKICHNYVNEFIIFNYGKNL